jgi:hypothetical protein
LPNADYKACWHLVLSTESTTPETLQTLELARNTTFEVVWHFDIMDENRSLDSTWGRWKRKPIFVFFRDSRYSF